MSFAGHVLAMIQRNKQNRELQTKRRENRKDQRLNRKYKRSKSIKKRTYKEYSAEELKQMQKEIQLNRRKSFLVNLLSVFGFTITLIVIIYVFFRLF